MAQTTNKKKRKRTGCRTVDGALNVRGRDVARRRKHCKRLENVVDEGGEMQAKTSAPLEAREGGSARAAISIGTVLERGGKGRDRVAAVA